MGIFPKQCLHLRGSYLSSKSFRRPACQATPPPQKLPSGEHPRSCRGRCAGLCRALGIAKILHPEASRKLPQSCRSLQKPPESFPKRPESFHKASRSFHKASTSFQKSPEASRSVLKASTKPPEDSRSLQKPPEVSRSFQKPPETSRSFQKLPENLSL